MASITVTIRSDRWIFLQEVYNYLSVKHNTIMRWIDQIGMPASNAEMPASNVGKLWRFKTEDIDEQIKRVDPPMRWRLLK